MRIIAGEMRSRRLKAPEGMDTRPTADRVKEALFSILQGRVYGVRALDLYGGSGALALEALSRGAQSCVIVDQSAKACRVIRENIEELRVGDRAELMKMSDVQALRALRNRGDAFDLIFLDPPYRMDASPVCALIAEYGLLKKDGDLVLEHSRDKTPPAVPPLLLSGRRDYGATSLSFYRLETTEEKE